MKIKKFVSTKPDSTMLVTLVSVSSSDRDTTVLDHHLPGAGLYVIEQDDITSIAESCEDFFPEFDLSVTAQRDAAFSEYSEMLIDSESYAPLPKRLC